MEDIEALPLISFSSLTAIADLVHVIHLEKRTQPIRSELLFLKLFFSCIHYKLYDISVKGIRCTRLRENDTQFTSLASSDHSIGHR